jgi:hypothetical protein
MSPEVAGAPIYLYSGVCIVHSQLGLRRRNSALAPGDADANPS